MKSIWKYDIIPGITRIQMPVGAKILTVQEQYGKPKLWALVDTDADIGAERNFRVYGTGHPVRENPGVYIGTFQLSQGTLIFHVFEEI